MREHIQSTIKKNIEQYLEKTKEKPVSDEIVAQSSSSESVKLTDVLTVQTTAVRRSRHLNEKKPYDKN